MRRRGPSPGLLAGVEVTMFKNLSGTGSRVTSLHDDRGLRVALHFLLSEGLAS